MYKNLKEKIRCSLCGNLPRPRKAMRTRPGGRLLCSECAVNGYGAEREMDDESLINKLLAEELPFECKNTEHGCDVILMPDELPAHEAQCLNYQVHCAVLSCEDAVGNLVYANHLETQHPDLQTVEKDNDLENTFKIQNSLEDFDGVRPEIPRGQNENAQPRVEVVNAINVRFGLNPPCPMQVIRRPAMPFMPIQELPHRPPYHHPNNRGPGDALLRMQQRLQEHRRQLEQQIQRNPDRAGVDGDERKILKTTRFPIFNRNFFEVGVVENGHVYRWICAHMDPEEAEHFQFRYVLENEEKGSKFEFTGKVHSLAQDPDKIIEDQENVFITGLKAVQKVATEENMVSYTIEIRNLKEEAKDPDLESGISDEDE